MALHIFRVTVSGQFALLDDEDREAPGTEASARAEQRAITSLHARGIAHRHLRVQATDMADVWRGERH
jgi:hypothetical protein